jgi:hypothetical protein
LFSICCAPFGACPDYGVTGILLAISKEKPACIFWINNPAQNLINKNRYFLAARRVNATKKPMIEMTVITLMNRKFRFSLWASSVFPVNVLEIKRFIFKLWLVVSKIKEQIVNTTNATMLLSPLMILLMRESFANPRTENAYSNK